MLNSLFLNGNNIVDLGTLQVSGLKSLTFITMDILSWSTFKNMLSGSIRLEYIRLDEVRLLDTNSQDNDYSPVSLPYLLDCQVRDHCASTPLWFIRGLRAPLLEKLTFEVDFFDEDDLENFVMDEAEDLSSLVAHLRDLVRFSFPT